jgi:molecular chaperone GrpE
VSNGTDRDGERHEHDEPITVTDKRRIDPVTGEVRSASAAGPAPTAGSAPEAGAAEANSAELDELKSTLQRVKAEYDNYRKRTARDQQVIAERAKASAVMSLLPILDDLDRARSHGDLETGPLKSVADKLATALEGLGLTGFGEEGDVFDPALHEAVQHEGDGSNPVVGTVMRRGYRIGDQVVRHALVGVVDAEPDAAQPVNAETGASGQPESN